GPYRVARFAAALPAPGAPAIAAGSALLACASGPVLVGALVTLRWEGIGVMLLPALLLVLARLYAAIVTLRTGELGEARVVAHASLLLDVPLLSFSFVHMHLIEAGHETLSLAAIAGAFALADGLQAALVLVVSSRS